MPKEFVKNDCKGLCALYGPGDPQTLTIDPTVTRPYESMPVAPSNLPAKFEAMKGKTWYTRRVWMGAFFDPELRQANRFPVVGCGASWGGDALSFGQANRSPIMDYSAWGEGGVLTAPDLRGVFARDPTGDKPLAGVFVSTLGPHFASNLLLPTALLGAYLLHHRFGRAIELAGAGAVSKHKNVNQEPPKVKAR
jgi:hypothetical protein